MISPDIVTSRELASALWLGVAAALLVALAVKKPDVRASLTRLLELRLPLELVILVGLFVGWLVLVVRVAADAGLWNDGLAKDTLLWFLVPGVGIFLSLGEVGQQGVLRRRLLWTLGLSALVAFYLNVLTFHVAIEIALQPLATVLVVAATFAQAPDQKRRAERLLALFGFVLLAATTLNIVVNVDRLDVWQVILSWFLPVWLTAAALPFVYVLGLYDQYRVLFRLADMDAVGWRARFRARLALLTGLGARASELVAVRPYLGTIRRVATAPTFAAARAEIADNRARRRAQAEAERQRAEDLVKMAGVTGTDAEGRQLDRREFKETTRALNTLAVRQMGWYRNRGRRYGREVLSLMSGHHALSGLPADHDIRIRIRRGGRSWYAWRWTPSGWVFAIGASGAPPTQSHYDGPALPKGYPGESPGWDDLPGPNWL